MNENAILGIRAVNKHFGATWANRDISLEIRRGSVHGLAGENGSGKSTLASIICGIQKPDSGQMFKDGAPYAPRTPLAANEAKVAMVVQELGVVGMVTPAVNLFLGRTSRFSRAGILNLRAMRRAAGEAFEKWNLPPVPLTGMAQELSIEQRKILELARALSVDPDFLVLDEISQTLSHDNRQMLHRFIRDFAARGKTVLMITHDIDEMLEVCDAVTVLRDGQVIDTAPADELTADGLKRLMIGREIAGDYYRSATGEEFSPETVLKVEHLCVPEKLEDVNFELHKGEILGVCGLSDAGIHDLGTALFGLSENRRGTVTHVPTGRPLRGSADVIQTGGAYLSKDRDAYGLMLNAGLEPNVAVANAGSLSGKLGFLSPRSQARLAEKAAREFEIKAASLDQPVRALSGGNKQKVNLSRWLVRELNYIILDCPTRGVDVGVKAYIYGVLEKARAKGLSILLITDELSEAIGMADRILVLRDRRLVATLSRNGEYTADKIVEVML